MYFQAHKSMYDQPAIVEISVEIIFPCLAGRTSDFDRGAARALLQIINPIIFCDLQR
jgi:hypothetical protein